MILRCVSDILEFRRVIVRRVYDILEFRHVILRRVFNNLLHKVTVLHEFVSQVLTLRGVLDIEFQQTCVFHQGEAVEIL